MIANLFVTNNVIPRVLQIEVRPSLVHAAHFSSNSVRSPIGGLNGGSLASTGLDLAWAWASRSDGDRCLLPGVAPARPRTSGWPGGGRTRLFWKEVELRGYPVS